VRCRFVHREIALAAAGSDDHVHPRQDVLVALDAGRIQRKAGGVGADTLPGFHLALIALLGNLRVEAHRCERMHQIGREALVVDIDASLGEGVPVRI
jgi:hypothetical protein